jgi:wyosine [tRNA(Phe)-imidazoG37] synthetase (radical SAM superfamily)
VKQNDHVLSTRDHSRDSAGLTYVYPVVSRRAGGVSIGINLNPNNACNWHCAYCQVPNLTRGSAPAIDLCRLEAELRGFLDAVVHGDFMQQQVPEEARRLNDIALSGNGEPTSAHEFEAVIELIGQVMADFGLIGKIKLVLITNGSLVHNDPVQRGIARMAPLNGEVWFKVDSATKEGIARINGVTASLTRMEANLRQAAALCPTWLQTCMFSMDGQPPSAAEQAAYLALLAKLKQQDVPLHGVLLYGLARPSMQPEAERLAALPADWMQAFAQAIEATGLPVKLSL